MVNFWIVLISWVLLNEFIVVLLFNIVNSLFIIIFNSVVLNVVSGFLFLKENLLYLDKLIVNIVDKVYMKIGV